MKSKLIEQFISKLPQKSIFVAKKIHMKKFSDVSFNTFLKYLERLTQKGVLKQISKGIYCRTVETSLGVIGVSDKEIEEYFIEGEKTGIAIGYKLYNKYNLSTQVANVIKVYSKKAEYQNHTVGNVQVKKLAYSPKLKFTIEYMEILENFNEIEDLDKKAFCNLCEKISQSYNEKLFLETYNLGNYKKRTIAFLKYILDCFNVKNEIYKQLNTLSKYNYPRLEYLNAY